MDRAFTCNRLGRPAHGISSRFLASDTLFGKLRPYLAKACNPNFDGICSSELLVLRPGQVDRRFLLYSLLTDGFISCVDASTYGAKMPRAGWMNIGRCKLPSPDAGEQQTVVKFLDRKTKQIDGLIERARIVVERLQEYRAALVTAAVTGKIDARTEGSS